MYIDHIYPTRMDTPSLNSSGIYSSTALSHGTGAPPSSTRMLLFDICGSTTGYITVHEEGEVTYVRPPIENRCCCPYCCLCPDCCCDIATSKASRQSARMEQEDRHFTR